jgi:uncharacterized protein
MPATLTYPGVYIEEIPSGVRTITGVATSITAFIGRTQRGPTDADDDSPVTINSFADFERKFGGLWPQSSLGFAVRDFYLNGGSQAIIVRLFHPSLDTEDKRTDAIKAAAAATAVRDAALNVQGIHDPLTDTDATAIADAAYAAVAKYPNDPEKTAATSVGDAIKDKAKKDAKLADVKAAADAAVKKAATITRARISANGVSKDDASAITAATAVRDAALNVSGIHDPLTDTDATAIGNAVDAAVAKYPDDPEKKAATAVGTAIKGKAKKDAKLADVKAAADAAIKEISDAAVSDAAGASNVLGLEAANEGGWANALRARITYLDDKTAQAVADSLHLDRFALGKDDLFNLTIHDDVTGDTEQFLNLTVQQGPRQVDKVLKKESRLVRVLSKLPGARPNPHADVPAGGRAWDDNIPPTYSEVTAIASDGDGLDQNDFTGQGKEDAKEGLYALEKADLFNLLCIPPYTSDGNVDTTLVGAAASYCELKRRAMLLVDPRSEWNDTASAKTGVADIGTNSKNAALFFPRLTQPNPLRDNQLEDFVPCGAVAGIFARTDTNRGVWKAPAGLDATLVGVPKLSVSLTDDENGELNPLGVNCLRVMPAAGRIVWGSRTLQGNDRLASEWKYIAVRRTALYIEESLYRGTQWVVFEPNDEPLWAQIRLNVGAFMHGLFRQGAFQGKTPQEAYFVKCDKETTPQDQINLGIVNIIVGFAPLKPAEFVVIQIQQMAGQIET